MSKDQPKKLEDLLRDGVFEAELQQREREAQQKLEQLKANQRVANEEEKRRQESDEKAAARYKANNPKGNREADNAAAYDLVMKNLHKKPSLQEIAAIDAAAEAWAQEIDSSRATPKLKQSDSREIDLYDGFNPPKSKSTGPKKINLDDNAFIDDGFINSNINHNQENDLSDFSSPTRIKTQLELKDEEELMASDLEREGEKAGIVRPKSSQFLSLTPKVLKAAASWGKKIMSPRKQKVSLYNKSQINQKDNPKKLNRQNAKVGKSKNSWGIGK